MRVSRSGNVVVKTQAGSLGNSKASFVSTAGGRDDDDNNDGELTLQRRTLPALRLTCTDEETTSVILHREKRDGADGKVMIDRTVARVAE